MPLEALNCTSCGSSDIQEVKPSTFFCNQCDSIFKHVDPTRIVVESASAFCACGGQAVSRCQSCAEVLCRSHDVVLAYGEALRVNYGLESVGILFRDDQWLSAVSTRGFGYTVPKRPELGTVLDVRVLLASLAPDAGHACWKCVYGQVPVAARAIVSGNLCAFRGCVSTALAARCEHCAFSYCDGHMTQPANEGSRPRNWWSMEYWQVGQLLVDKTVMLKAPGMPSKVVELPISNDFCAGCTDAIVRECEAAVRAAIGDQDRGNGITISFSRMDHQRGVVIHDDNRYRVYENQRRRGWKKLEAEAREAANRTIRATYDAASALLDSAAVVVSSCEVRSAYVPTVDPECDASAVSVVSRKMSG
jgi:hypothetical protein